MAAEQCKIQAQGTPAAACNVCKLHISLAGGWSSFRDYYLTRQMLPLVKAPSDWIKRLENGGPAVIRIVGGASFRNGLIHLSEGLIRRMTEDEIMKETLRDYQINPRRFWSSVDYSNDKKKKIYILLLLGEITCLNLPGPDSFRPFLCSLLHHLFCWTTPPGGHQGLNWALFPAAAEREAGIHPRRATSASQDPHVDSLAPQS